MFEREIQDFSTTERWETFQRRRRQSLGEHSHNVAIYADQIATFFDWQGDRGALLRFAIWHHAVQILNIADLPEHTKVRADSELMPIIKVADHLDAIFYLSLEVRDGGDPVFKRILTRVTAQLPNLIAALPFSDDTKLGFTRIVDSAIDNHQHNATPSGAGRMIAMYHRSPI